MSLQRRNYSEVRNRMRPGDIIAFGGKGIISTLIKGATKSDVSHIGMVVQSRALRDSENQVEFINSVMESTKLHGRTGVMQVRLSWRVENYEGEVWWLRLREDLRSRLERNTHRFYDFLRMQEGKPYDLPQAIKAVIDSADNDGWSLNKEDFSELFCSELVTGALEAGGVIHHEAVNASEVIPIEVCQFQIYEPCYVLLKGERKEIHGFNSNEVETT